MKSTQHRSRAVTAVVAAAALVGLTACQSDPSPRRVAADLINTLAENDEERDCMLELLEDEYDNDTLKQIGEAINNGDTAAQADARDALERFERDLANCR